MAAETLQVCDDSLVPYMADLWSRFFLHLDLLCLSIDGFNFQFPLCPFVREIMFARFGHRFHGVGLVIIKFDSWAYKKYYDGKVDAVAT